MSLGALGGIPTILWLPIRIAVVQHSAIMKTNSRQQTQVMKIVVIGGSGLIGTKLVHNLRYAT